MRPRVRSSACRMGAGKSFAVGLFLDEELVVVEGKVIFKPGISRFFSTDAN